MYPSYAPWRSRAYSVPLEPSGTPSLSPIWFWGHFMKGTNLLLILWSQLYQQESRKSSVHWRRACDCGHSGLRSRRDRELRTGNLSFLEVGLHVDALLATAEIVGRVGLDFRISLWSRRYSRVKSGPLPSVVLAPLYALLVPAIYPRTPYTYLLPKQTCRFYPSFSSCIWFVASGIHSCF